MAKFKVGDIVEVSNSSIEFVCSIQELLPDEDVKEFEDSVAIYIARWEGPENPDVEPEICLWEHTNGDMFVSDESEDGIDYQEVSAKLKGE